MLKKITIFCLVALVSGFAQDTQEQNSSASSISNSPSKQEEQKNLIEKIKEKEAKIAVPRETVPVEESKFLVDTSIPKTAHYLPFLQTLLNIKVGTLPNPIGISLIGSYTDEKYNITKFRGTIGGNLGGIIIDGLAPSVVQDKQKILQAIQNNQQIPGWAKPIAKGFVGKLIDKIGQGDQATISNLENFINSTLGAGETKEWQLSEGKVRTKTGAVGFKADVYLLPFMNLFFTTAYLNVNQSTNVGNATIPLSKPLGGLSSITFPVGTIENKLDGFLVMGGTNLAIGYKGFFASCMISGGYVRLDDLHNNIKGFVEKPFMYIAPRVGYSYNGVFTAHFGVQRIELFGETKGKDLSQITGGLVSGYSVELKKFPVNFLAGAQFMFMRDFGISIEYVGSPDVKGFNAEVAYRF